MNPGHPIRIGQSGQPHARGDAGQRDSNADMNVSDVHSMNPVTDGIVELPGVFNATMS